ncbi:LAFE_0C06832g1_1 [Lachancea fermentati]|uniref:LAFE_0C06832g1_1 n=1 Tax=Lachancea fermentati TaxID=4955 RepID=A0A1G4M9N5_LACFM|nr:LAFE_0C06832g1_1 [Lachancea fermentati]
MDKETAPHKIPDFYCCYLLRSIPKPQSFYIGSTPNPVRRLRQHNGVLTNGSAYRTKREGARPWEMAMCVHGFTSKIAALQFEHAWQHSYHTHYIRDEDRIVKKKAAGRTFHHKLGNVRLLLNNPYFRYMDLTVHMFSLDALKIWEEDKFVLGGDINISISENSIQGTQSSDSDIIEEYSSNNMRLVEELYKSILKEHKLLMEYMLNRLFEGETKCQICRQTFNYVEETMRPLVAFCLNIDCNFSSHLACLHRVFLDDDRITKGVHILTPMLGGCPFCERHMPWPKIAKFSTHARSEFELGDSQRKKI